jgi:hypothetical protein
MQSLEGEGEGVCVNGRNEDNTDFLNTNIVTILILDFSSTFVNAEICSHTAV